MKLLLTVYYDITCPYCCVAHRRLTEVIGPTLRSEHGILLDLKVQSHQLISSLPSGNTDAARGPVAPPVDKIKFLGQFLGGSEGVRHIIREIEVESTKHGVRLHCLDGGLACNSANAHRLLYILGEECGSEMNEIAAGDHRGRTSTGDGPLVMISGEVVKQAVLMKIFRRYFELGQAPTVENLTGAVEEVLVENPEMAPTVRAALEKWDSDPFYCKNKVQELLDMAPPKLLGKAVPYAVAGDVDNKICVDVSTETTNDEIVKKIVDIASQTK